MKTDEKDTEISQNEGGKKPAECMNIPYQFMKINCLTWIYGTMRCSQLFYTEISTYDYNYSYRKLNYTQRLVANLDYI